MIAAVCAATRGGAIARADDVDALLQKGVELRRRGKEQEALDTFQHAAQIKRTPHVVAQVALAEQALGLWVAAERDLKEALDAGANDSWIGKNRHPLDESLRVIQSHLGSLAVLGQPADAEVLADGEVVGRLPIATPVRLPIGEVSLIVRKDGYDKVTRVVTIARGGLVRENIALHRTPVTTVAPLTINTAPGAAFDAPTGGSGMRAGASAPLMLNAMPASEESPARDRSPDRSSHRSILGRWWFWTAIGVIAVGAGAGVYLLTRPQCNKTSCDGTF
jgi:hypothetical protein